jgi:hypothetical protein
MFGHYVCKNIGMNHYNYLNFHIFYNVCSMVISQVKDFSFTVNVCLNELSKISYIVKHISEIPRTPNMSTLFLLFQLIRNNIQFEETSFHSLIKSGTSFIIQLAI